MSYMPKSPYTTARHDVQRRVTTTYTLSAADAALIAEDVLSLLEQEEGDTLHHWAGTGRLAWGQVVAGLRHGRAAQYEPASGRRWVLRGGGHGERLLERVLRDHGFTVARERRATYVSL